MVVYSTKDRGWISPLTARLVSSFLIDFFDHAKLPFLHPYSATLSNSNVFANIYLSKENGGLVFTKVLIPNNLLTPTSTFSLSGVALPASQSLRPSSTPITASRSSRNAGRRSRTGSPLELPVPFVCDRHTYAISLRLSKTWCLTSYKLFQKLREKYPADGEKGHGIRLWTANFFCDKEIEKNAEEYEKMLEIEQSQNLDFERDLVEAKGGKPVTEHIFGDLYDHEDELLQQYDAKYIINATGLGAFESAADKTVCPSVRRPHPGAHFQRSRRALVASNDHEKRDEDGSIVLMVAQNDQTLVCGGLAQTHEVKVDLNLDDPEMKRMWARCSRFVPGLEKAELDPPLPIVKGLRPARGDNVRVRRELRRKVDGSVSKIVHSYRQGSFTLSFWCAGERVLALVEEVAAGVPPVPIQSGAGEGRAQ